MSELEDRLQQWGAQQRAAAGPVPVGLSRRGGRRWLPLAAAAAAVLVVGGTAVAVTSGSSTRSALPVASAGPTPTPDADVVPWADLPAGPYVEPSPLPAATADPSVRACRAADLSARDSGVGNGASGSLFGAFVLTNTSSTPCRLTGTVTGLTGVRRGARVPIRLEGPDYGGFRPGVVPAVLRPGADSLVQWAYESACPEAPGGAPTFTRLRMTLLGGTLPVAPMAGAPLQLPCTGDRPVLAVDELGDPPPEPTYAPDPRGGLTVSLASPSTVVAGAVLRYTVTLANSTDHQIALDPCPEFLQVFGRAVKEPHTVNCAQAQPLAAGGTERFAMELTVPAGEVDGDETLQWILEVGGEAVGPATATAQVTVAGGHDPATDTATCTSTSTQAPCGSGMQPGQSYSYTLYTHCGVRSLDADGRRWVVDEGQKGDSPRGNPPPGIDNPFDAGQVTLDKPGVRLEWVSHQGRRFTFHPEESNAGQVGCK